MRYAICSVVMLGVGVAGAAEPAGPDSIELAVRLKLGGDAALKASDVTCALFPGGKRCAFTFGGCRSPKTIRVLAKLGFGTTVYCSPRTSPEQLKALEAAGADVGIGIWGGKGTYASHIGGNTIQEAFDAVVTSRMVMRQSCRGPLACGSIGGHYGITSFPINRSPENRSGFGYAYHDANYLLLSDNKPYMVYLRRRGEPLLATRANYDNRMRSRRVPNEIIYYQILANQFRGTLRRAAKGQIVRFTLRDFKAPDLAECARVLGPFGRHELIWNASEAEIGANEYVRRKVAVKSVRSGRGEVEVVLRVERDTFVPFLLTPLPLKLPKGTEVERASVAGVDCPVTAREEATYVDVPVRAALTGPCEMSLKPAEPDMTVPDRMPLVLTVTNASDEPITGATLGWVDSIGFSVTGGERAPFDLPPKATRRIEATAATVKGARFGITPLAAVVTARHRGAERTFMQGFEVVVAPRLRVEMDPMQRIPMRPGRLQYFFVHVDNKRSTSPGGPPNTFISHKAGPCKGTVSLDLPEGMTAEPAELPLELGAGEGKTLIFKVTNRSWGAEPVMVRPVIRFAGERDPVNVLFPGTTVIREKERIDYEPLNDEGLLVEATWDDRIRNGRFDRSCGNPSAHFYPGHRAAYHNEGVKGWCMNSQRVCQIHDSFKNIDYWAGTVCMWVRKDPFIRNENTYVPKPQDTIGMLCGRGNRGETLFTVGLVQNVSSSDSGLTIRRFRSWKGQPGYLQLSYQLMGRRVIACQGGPFEWTEQWRHVAATWSVPQRRLELYIDGKLAAKADPGEGPWHAAPWDRAGPSGWNMNVITSDHGAWCGTCRDEVYIYNRPLTAEQIRANMARARRE